MSSPSQKQESIEDVKAEKDSLFSTEESEEHVEEVEVTEETHESLALPEFTESELETLVSYVKNITILYDLQPSDWNLECEKTIKEWFIDITKPLLTIYFKDNDLVANCDVPDHPIVDLTYFIRQPNQIYTVENFYDTIHVGTVDNDILNTIINVLHNIYGPIYFTNPKWPDSMRNEFDANLTKTLSKLTEIFYKMRGLTMFYVPITLKYITAEQVMSNKETVKRLEAVIVQWTKQVQIGLQDEEQNTSDDMLMISDIYEFWKYRYDNLLTVDYQYDNDLVKHNCNILLLVRSSYAQQFVALREKLIQCIVEAKSNLEYLQVLLEPVKELSQISSPTEIPEKLSKILNLIRFIWMESLYFNTKDRITQLCRSLSNQIIIKCKEYINLKIVFEDKHTHKAIEMFQKCIGCMRAYIKVYVLAADTHNTYGEMAWDLEKPPIFNHVDAFIQRCKDMIEICEAMIVFGFYDEIDDLLRPVFCGARSTEFQILTDRIDKIFNDSLKEIENVQSIIFNTRVSKWYDDMLKFRMKMKDVEVIVENLANEVFDEVANIEEGIESLAAFHNYAKRKTLKTLFENKTLEVYQMFQKEILEYKNEIEKQDKEYPSSMPYYAGQAHLLHLKKNYLKTMKKLFDDAGWMLPCSLAKEVFNQYEKLLSSIDVKTMDIYKKWIDSSGEDLNGRLKRPLMCKSVTKPGLLECNIDRSLFPLFKEIKYWLLLEYDIPTDLRNFNEKANKIQFIYENVVDVVMNYNKIICSLSDEERLLFKRLIMTVESKILPGLRQLTWENDIVDEYIADCNTATAELQRFLDDYKACNMKIVSICEKICDTTIITFKSNYIFNLEELQNAITASINKTFEQIMQYYQQIIKYLIIVYEGFENHMGQMAEQWVTYINNFDYLIEEALRISCRKSLAKMMKILHGDVGSNPDPILYLRLNLVQSKIVFDPSLVDVGFVISTIFETIVEALEYLPRLNDKFHVADIHFKPYAKIIADDVQCNNLQEDMNNEIKFCVNKLRTYMKSWEALRDIWDLDKELFIKKYEITKPSAATFDANISRYITLVNDIASMESVSTLSFLKIVAIDLKSAITDHCIQWQFVLSRSLYNMMATMIDDVYNYIKTNSQIVMKKPENLSEMQTAIEYYQDLLEDVPRVEESFVLITDQMLIIDKYQIIVPEDVRQKENDIQREWAKYLEILADAEKMLGYSKETFKAGLLEEAEVSRQEAKNLLDDFLLNGPFSSKWSAKDGLKYLAEMRAKLEELKQKRMRIGNDLAIFGVSFPGFPELDMLDKELATLQMVWELVEEWEIAWDNYKGGEFWQIRTEDMEEKAQNLFRKFTRLSRELKDKNWTIIDDTRQRVDAFRRTLPLIGNLKNPAMRPRHWERVRNAIGQDFDENSPDFNLEAIFAFEMHKFADEINEISNAATMELQIENGLKNIAEIWETMHIQMVPYRDTGIYRYIVLNLKPDFDFIVTYLRLRGIEECFQALEEHGMQLSVMKSTKFVEPFAKEVDYWERTLSYIMETVEAALSVQRQWIYLENIFVGEDIRRQLPHEIDKFTKLTEVWRNITYNLYDSDSILHGTHIRPPPYLLKILNHMNESLEQIQRALEMYLETKRHIFPRFYFISNDDLLEILASSKNPDGVQVHLKKLFDNLNKIKIEKINTQTGKTEAAGMYSDDGEYIEFVKPVVLDGPVEKWLLNLESAMRLVLKTKFKPCRTLLKKMLNKRDKWLMSNCGQLCNASSLIQWTTDCTRALVHAKIMESKKPLKRLRRKQNQVLEKLSELSRRDLNKLQRLKANALITIEIHSRDVIDRLYKANCRDVNAFEWFSQLRFYWDRDTDECIIKQTNTSFRYGYEYNGNSGRLVITPLTDRCYITLTTALHLHRGGSPKGPAGTGKTETVKDLGKAMGMWVIVNNCSEGLDYKSMGKCFSGLAQTGAWGCFDEFNRINIEVLSVVAQQILSILSAIAQKLHHLTFEGSEIKLRLTCGIFITMNPGYAGRTELPDNLKSMFRPISMMVPDSGIIAENILFSDGFQNTKVLAKKVFTLYQLAIQQLSKQDHYDFGLRSMVALLRYGGRKRRLLSHLPEEQVVYLAMRDMNIARLTAEDLPLFNGIMSDIFPSVSLPTVDYVEMIEAIKQSMTEKNLQPIPAAITKVIQLYETKSSRHSVMILGATGSAKTATWNTLKGALGIMAENNKPGFNSVQVYPLNPKALNLGELYGEYNISTNEWSDGVISSIMRFTCAEQTPTEKWILFDGPVDAVWIENMNSVMDDNKVLTLINSDRITMPEQVSLLFEVGDLAVASPATVSRCGMVYNDYKDWGWMPFVTSWVNKFKDKGENFRETIMGYFKYYIPPILHFKHINCVEAVDCAEINLIISLCSLLDIFLTKENGVNPADETSFEDMSKNWFLFCMIWSLCCTTDEEGRKKLDSFIRDKEGVFPIKDTIYEYYVNVLHKCFAPWEEKLPFNWKFDPGEPFFKITVPTVDTIRYEFIVKSLLTSGYPVLLTGPVGTAKTSTSQSVLNSLDPNLYAVLNVNMSAQTTSQNLQDAIEGRVEKRTKENFAPPGGKNLIVFLDDLNMPAKETYGSQPPLELLRQWMDYRFWYDRQTQKRKYIQSMHILGAMGPPGGGRNVISSRLLSNFNVINITFPDETNIVRIFGTMLTQHLCDFTEDLKLVGKEITATTIDLYNKVVTKMLPTPTKIHYLFNLRDISKVFQGLLRSHKNFQNEKSSLLKLWTHECFRVFFDRLTDETDRQWFFNEMNDQLGKHFDVTLHSLCPKNDIPCFADFLNPYHYYEELEINVLRKYVENQMEEYNASPGVVRMDLVLFKDAIQHICRIVRVISQPRGNMLLIGIGGSGRQSLARIAAYICELNTFQINVTKNYRVNEFREDLKRLYILTGVETKPTSFLFNDTQITVENFLEIINNMLSSGEVANLYKPDEMEDIKGRLDDAATKAGIMHTTEAIYAFLIERARANLHIVLCMSPIGDAFRNRLRQYPALINCTTIDWFMEWPKEALLEVAAKYLAEVNFLETITEDTEKKRQSFTNMQDVYQKSIAQIFATIHDSVSKCSRRMEIEMKRHNYVTPTNYLELVAGYKKMLSDKRKEIASQANKLRNGLWKIDDCRDKVASMSLELEDAKVKVAEFQEQCDNYLVIIVGQKKEVDEKTQEVTQQSIKIREEETQCQHLANVAQADLDEAMPALEEAIRALDSLSKKDISEMKSYTTPPQKVKLVMEAVNILKGLEPNWEAAKRLLGEINFLKDLKEFDRNHISEKTLKKIAAYTTNVEFVPEKVGIVSLAAKSLCMWVIAIEKYAKVWKYVGPKVAKLEEVTASLREKQRQLAEAQAKLAELNALLAKLQKEYEEKLLQKEELNRKAEMLRLKLERAYILVECLAGERQRWGETVEQLDAMFILLPGDCVLATAFISYLGPFVSNYRENLVEQWKSEVVELEIPYSEEFNVVTFLSDATTIREWNIQGLPADEFSTENGIIVTKGSRWPLVIDPQCQAQKWIKAMEAKNELHVIDFSTKAFMKIVEKCVQFGKPILVQNILEDMDPSMNPILAKMVVKQGGENLIKLDDKFVSYHDDFCIFFTTKLTNPHYPPEISTKTTLVNFAVKEQGLEAQLLGIVVRKEKPQLEEQKDNLVTTIAKGKRTLIDLENELLRLLNETRGSLLEDAELFNTLQSSKSTAEAVKQSLEISEATEIEIDAAREGYRTCAQRASILFFVLNDMGRIDPMYQFALDSYIFLFINSIEKSKKSADLQNRIKLLNEYHTYAVYKNTCRALFEHHKLLFSFHMCMKILDAQGKLVPAEYNFLLKGGVVLDRDNQMENPCADWLNEDGWDNITELDKLKGFHGVVDTFERHPREWKEWYTHTEPETLPLLDDWQNICNDFQKMLFVRSLRQDRVSFCISNFIIKQLDAIFVEPPVLDIKAVLEESVPQTPLIFVLSPGVDPAGNLTQLAEQSQMTTKFSTLSLGQGQAPIATKLLNYGIENGHWVFLANCHLSLSWMPDLDKIVENLQTSPVHPDFRLWLSSSPHPDFPLSILQAGIKMTTEPPKGLKANLKRLYTILTEDQLSCCGTPEKYKKLLFSLCFFHGILLERKKFQQLGWNVIYSFNDSDFEVSQNLLTIYLDEYTETPWDALKYLIAGVNYGGHVTDDWDRRLLLTYINQYFCDDAINIPTFRLSSLLYYYIPKDGSLQSYLDYISLLPNIDRPEVFGQHSNADITSLISETRMMCETLMSLQIQTESSETESKEVKVSQLAADILSRLPNTMDYELVERLMGLNKSPLDVVLLQEIQRYNNLLNRIRTSLEDLQKGILGLVVMSSELEEIFTCIYEGRVPSGWLNAYPSLKLLGSWTRDLVARVEHFAVWAETTHPPIIFWLSAYTFPTGFLTAVLQTAARQTEVPIDSLSWEFVVLTLKEKQIAEPPESGVYVRGTFLEGAGWDTKKTCLIEPKPMQLVCPMPLIHFKPVEQLKKKSKGLYSCPCYYFPVRCGSGTRPSFVVAVDLKSGDQSSDFWIKRGTALLLSLAT